MAGHGESPDWADRGAGGTAPPMVNGRGEGKGWQRVRTGRTSLGPEDRPSKLSHALSVLRKRRIGVCCGVFRRRGAARKEGGREGLKTTIGP